MMHLTAPLTPEWGHHEEDSKRTGRTFTRETLVAAFGTGSRNERLSVSICSIRPAVRQWPGDRLRRQTAPQGLGRADEKMDNRGNLERL
jgi:hypothetical protein